MLDDGFMLRRLGAGVRPTASTGRAHKPASDEPIGFEAMIERARAGELRTGRSVRVAPGLTDEFPNELLDWLGAVLDAGEASAAQTVAAVVCGRVYLARVGDRTVEAEADLAAGGVAPDVGLIAVLPACDGQPNRRGQGEAPAERSREDEIAHAAAAAFERPIPALFAGPGAGGGPLGTPRARENGGGGVPGLANASLAQILASARDTAG